MSASGDDDFLTRAEMLEEIGDLVEQVLEVLYGAAAAGVTARAVPRLRSAAWKLDPAGGIPAYHAGSFDSGPGGGFGSDVEFLEALWAAEDEIVQRQSKTGLLQQDVDDALSRTQEDLTIAHRDERAAQQALSAAYAMPVQAACNGCHGRRNAAIADAEQRIAAAEQRIAAARKRLSGLEAAASILGPLSLSLTFAIEDLRRVPHDLGEAYEVVYQYIQRGGKLPKAARRFVTGRAVWAAGVRA